MMNFNGINEVMQRIAEIQARFGEKPSAQAAARQNFQQTLQTEMQQGKTSAGTTESTPAGSTSSPAAAKVAATGEVGSMILSAARKYNVDPKLVSAVAETESNFRQSAVSSAGAVGVMQLMPQTAASLGVNPYDERQNIEGGAKYLRQMLDSFGGDVKKAVAAYNAGAQAVKNYHGVPPYRETQNYVNKVLDLYQ